MQGAATTHHVVHVFLVLRVLGRLFLAQIDEEKQIVPHVVLLGDVRLKTVGMTIKIETLHIANAWNRT